MMALRALAPFVKRASTRHAEARCELCGASVAEHHAHVVEVTMRTLKCACGGCAILFRDAGAGGGRWRTVPERVLVDPAFTAGDDALAALEIPVRLAFLTRPSTVAGWVAFYPSPGGTVETPLSEAAAQALIATVPLAAEVEPDVEALLIHRRPGGATDCFLAPIDACYELVACVRRSWQGFSGGDAARQAIDGFFDGLRSRCTVFDGGGGG
jgi:hypothetical protein